MAEVSVPTREVSVVLVLDVSGSMSAEDIKPSRLAGLAVALLGSLVSLARANRLC